jgi:Pyridoxamine 5'-phosphate oxidase
MSWPDDVDAVLAGHMTAALAYLTPAGGAVVTAVAPVGMRDRGQGTVTFTTSLGFGKKLERIERDPRVALAYHAREHGFASCDSFVLVQGRCRPVPPADEDWNSRVLGPASARFMGPPRRGRFWDRWLREYYADRVPVTVDVARIVVWPSLDCSGEPVVHGAERPDGEPPSQAAPKKGTGPRLDARQATSRVRHPGELGGGLRNGGALLRGQAGTPQGAPRRPGLGRSAAAAPQQLAAEGPAEVKRMVDERGDLAGRGVRVARHA